MRPIIALILLSAVSCKEAAPAGSDTGAAPPLMAFGHSTLRIARGADTTRWAIELAVSPDQRTMGLMERQHLPPDAGMLFVYDGPQPPEAGFWMYRTRIPLDIAFVDSEGVIRRIMRMDPCPAVLVRGCPSYAPGTAYQYALEVNAGAFGRRGISEGHVLAPDDLRAARSGRRAVPHN